VAFESARRRETPAEIVLLLGLSRLGVALVGIDVLLVLGSGSGSSTSATGATAPAGSMPRSACSPP